MAEEGVEQEGEYESNDDCSNYEDAGQLGVSLLFAVTLPLLLDSGRLIGIVLVDKDFEVGLLLGVCLLH